MLMSRLCAAGPIDLAASKSTYGHAETAAGTISICQAIQCLKGTASQALLHLRTMNPLVMAMLDEASKGTQLLACTACLYLFAVCMVEECPYCISKAARYDLAVG